MKASLLIFITILNFSFINSFHKSSQRKLQEIPNISKRNLADSINKLMLVGFGDHIEGSNRFYIYFKKYDESIIYYWFLNYTISYEGGKNPTNISCSVYRNLGDNLIYSCPTNNLNDTQKVQILNDKYTFYNITGDKIPTEIVESSLAKTSKSDILSRNTSLNYRTFYLDNISVSDNTAELRGKLDIGISKEMANIAYTLESNAESYKCKVTNTTIKFNLTKTVSDNLIGKMLFESKEPSFLIFSNDENVDDLLLYSTFTNWLGITDLLGYDNYKKGYKANAINRIHFRGGLNVLKKYIRFTARIRTPTLLRLLEETYVNATGIRDYYNSDIENGHIIYNVTFEKTENMDIIGIDKISNFKFSNDNTKDSSFISTIIFDISNGTFDPMNNKTNNYQTFGFNNNYEDIIVNGSSFSFIINTKKEIQLTNESEVSLFYIPLEEIEEDESLKCSINKINSDNYLYKIACSPNYDIYAIIYLLQIKNNKINSRLRLLQSDENTILFPENERRKYTLL